MEGVTPGYVRNGPTPLFVALDIAIGQVMLTNCQPHHTHQEFFLSFLNHLEANVPLGWMFMWWWMTQPPLSLIRSGGGWEPGPATTCIALPRTPPGWIYVEIWFNIITQRAIRRGVFRIVKKLIAKIEDFVAQL